jgi:SRSO17 transposase
LAYVSGLLRLEAKRNMANIGRKSGIDEQALRHFISDSPWDGSAVIGMMQEAVAQRGELAGGVLLLDDSGDAKAGEMSAGVGRQYNGRHHQVENSQVGVFLAYAKGQTWTWVDGALYLPEKWFTAAWSNQRQKAAIPPQRHYQKKTELGWQMIQRVQAAGIPFAAVAFDSGYGHEAALRDRCRAAHLEYYADIKGGDVVYFSDPTLPLATPGVSRTNWLQQHGWRVAEWVQQQPIAWQTLTLRPDARGLLTADFAAYPVWTLRDDGQVVADTLLLRRDPTRITYTLTNAAPNTPLLTLAQRKSQRYFVERSIQDAKSELGFAEFQALKYRAWQHHLALTILASWFIAETRLDWAVDHPPDPALLDQYQTDVLPALSLANVRELLRVALPLPHLSPQQAAALVVQHLANRTRSRRSRLKKHSGP